MEGYKTYIVAVVMAGATFLLNMGIIDQTAFDMILPFLGALGLAALRASIPKKIKPKVKKVTLK